MEESTLEAEVNALRLELKKLNEQRFIQIQNSLVRLLAFQFLRGLALGLGTVVGATILVSFLVYLLSNIDFIPVIGEWASEIAAQIRVDK
jgi:hypothetical protein